MSANDDSDSQVSTMHSDESEDELPALNDRAARQLRYNEDDDEDSDDDDDEPDVGPAEARENYQSIFDRVTGGVYYRSSHYRAKQAGAREVRLLEGHSTRLQANVADIGLVRDKLLHHQRVNAANNYEDTPEHKAQKEGDATALETCEALLDKPTRDLVNITRELDEARALQADRVTIYTDYAGMDDRFFKETAGGFGDGARFLHHANARCCRHYVYPIIAIVINVSVPLTRREIMDALGVKTSNQGVIMVLKGLVKTGFVRLNARPTANSSCSYDLNPEAYDTFRLKYDMDFTSRLEDIPELIARIRAFITEYRDSRQQFQLGPQRAPAAPTAARVRNSTSFTSPPPAQRRRVVTGERTRLVANNEVV